MHFAHVVLCGLLDKLRRVCSSLGWLRGPAVALPLPLPLTSARADGHARLGAVLESVPFLDTQLMSLLASPFAASTGRDEPSGVEQLVGQAALPGPGEVGGVLELAQGSPAALAAGDDEDDASLKEEGALSSDEKDLLVVM